MSSIVQDAPKFTERDAIRIAKELFEIDVTARLLPSERDQNFLLTDSTGKSYVLKFANSTEHVEVLDFQNQAMMHINSKRDMFDQTLSVAPIVCPTGKGAEITSIDGLDGSTHFVRLLTYLPGKPLAQVRPHDPHLLTSLGSFFGNVDRALQDFDQPAARRDFHWDLKNAGRIITDYVDLIQDPENRDLVLGFFDRYQAETEPQLPDLRTSVIHNDANDYNVLIEPDGQWHHKVSGVIDFGDMVHTQTVNELAIACAYAMLDKADPLAAADQKGDRHAARFVINRRGGTR